MKMANTYFKLEKEVVYPGFDKYPGYTNKYTLTLTAFMGGKGPNPDKLQLTVQTESSLPYQSGVGYLTLNDEEIELLYQGMLERKNGNISATGNEQSIYSPADS